MTKSLGHLLSFVHTDVKLDGVITLTYATGHVARFAILLRPKVILRLQQRLEAITAKPVLMVIHD
jgi:hypothetical protein